MFRAALLNALPLGESEAVIIMGLPKSEPDIIPALSGISPRNGMSNCSLIRLAPPSPNM